MPEYYMTVVSTILKYSKDVNTSQYGMYPPFRLLSNGIFLLRYTNDKCSVGVCLAFWLYGMRLLRYAQKLFTGMMGESFGSTLMYSTTPGVPFGMEAWYNTPPRQT